jgi:hypothetical protein
MPFGSVPDKTEAKCITSRPSPRAGLVLGPNQEMHFVPALASPTINQIRPRRFVERHQRRFGLSHFLPFGITCFRRQIAFVETP